MLWRISTGWGEERGHRWILLIQGRIGQRRFASLPWSDFGFIWCRLSWLETGWLYLGINCWWRILACVCGGWSKPWTVARTTLKDQQWCLGKPASWFGRDYTCLPWQLPLHLGNQGRLWSRCWLCTGKRKRGSLLSGIRFRAGRRFWTLGEGPSW